MDVAVDQSWHQSTAAEIDFLRTVGIDHTVFHGGETAIPHQDLLPPL
jgi:acetylglutamate kinase